ncbi:carbon-monoxide dehydrogenase small subunit [Hydrogenispora ethanolica]|uniref:Carbon-monoxide dehydrogenase small subunit n=1 Tax=Hydrogenispora ethanolica TaxID=1082276 RepID=A0A4R1S1W9_HYDET|nr:(2Fe-2S)-binding protein [Hydrogenispora ethanolica]TCL73155.1 carbon-monoxide dehydrogenase small subunit [Hydrogenispora ethanolica]
MAERIEFVLNGRNVAVETDPLRRLLDVLREDLGYTGTKEGCGEGECGACSVLVDGRLVNSCLAAVGTLAGREVMTIEGFRETERFKVLERAFGEAGAVQCGFCTPGMLLAGEALLRRNPQPSETEIRTALSGNLCRCTGYGMIVAAIQDAAQRGEGLW